MTLQAGVTHDIVIWINNTIQCGLTVKNYTYNRSYLPTFIPRMSVGDQTGLDTNRWRSFYMGTFDKGAGQRSLTSGRANGAFYQSYGLKPALADYANFGDTPTVELQTAPDGNYQFVYRNTQNMQFDVDYPSWVVRVAGMSTTFVVNKQTICNIATGAVATFPSPVVSVCEYTGIIFATTFTRGISIANGASVSTPTYNTLADNIIMYDQKVWRSWDNQTAYLNPQFTTQAWSSAYEVGSRNFKILNTCEFGGRLYFGKEDGLYVFDAGRIYAIQPFSDKVDVMFTFMKVFRGAMYFNIGNDLWRLTGGGAFEKINTPYKDYPNYYGVYEETNEYKIELKACHVHQEALELEVWVSNPNYSIPERQMWYYDPSLGSMFREFELSSSLYGHVAHPQGTLHVYYIKHTSAYGSYTQPAGYPGYPSVDWFETSWLDMGMPELDKVFGRVTINGKTYHPPLYYSFASSRQNPLFTPVKIYKTDWSRVYGEQVYIDTPDWSDSIGPYGASWFFLYSKTRNEYFDLSFSAISTSIVVQGRYMSVGTEFTTVLTQSIQAAPFPTQEWSWKWPQGSSPAQNIGPETGLNGPQYAVGFRPFSGGFALHNVRPGNFRYLTDLSAGYEQMADDYVGKTGKGIQLAFQPIEPIKSLEVEWMPAGRLYERVSGVAMAVDAIEIQPGMLENSGLYVARTLWSCGGSQLPYIVGVPWPTPHTMRVQVKMRDPGTSVPILAYDNSVFIGAEVPFTLEEV